MRDELIWKYIDGVCSAEEIAIVKQNLESDPEWTKMYNKFVLVNQELESALMIPMTQEFKSKVMLDGLRVLESQKEFSVLPKKLIILISIMFIVSVLVSLYAKDGTSLISFPKLDPEMMNMATWITISFLSLFGIDKLLKNMHVIRKNLHLVV